MKKKKKGELRGQQKQNALVPIKSVHSNFLLEKNHTKRVKVELYYRRESSICMVHHGTSNTMVLLSETILFCTCTNHSIW